MAVEPLDDTALERQRLGLLTCLTAVELSNAGALVKEDPPVLSRPATITKTQQVDDAVLVVRESANNRIRRRRCSFKDQIVAIECYVDTSASCCPQGLCRRHSLARQACRAFRSGTDW